MNLARSLTLISAKEAAQVVGYTADYVSKLARDGEIVAQQNGRQWFVDVESLKLFSLKKEAIQKRRNEELRLERLNHLAASKIKEHDQRVFSGDKQNKFVALGLSAVMMLCLILAGSLATVSYTEKLSFQALLIGASEVERSFWSLFSHDTKSAESRVKTNPFDTESFGVVLQQNEFTEAELAEIKKSFSDEVIVERTSSSTGVITPVFSNGDDQSFHFVMVPVDASSSTVEIINP